MLARSPARSMAAGGDAEVGAEFVGDDVSHGGFAEAGGTVK